MTKYQGHERKSRSGRAQEPQNRALNQQNSQGFVSGPRNEGRQNKGQDVCEVGEEEEDDEFDDYGDKNETENMTPNRQRLKI